MNIQERSTPDLSDLESLAVGGSGVRPEHWLFPRDERLAATYEHVGAGIVEVDGDGRMLRVNQQLCRLTGYSPHELLGRTIFQETLPDDVDADLQQFKRQRDVDLRVPKAVRRIVVCHELADQLAVFLDRNKCDGANTLLGNRCLQRVRKVRRLDILEIDRPRMLVVSCPG